MRHRPSILLVLICLAPSLSLRAAESAISLDQQKFFETKVRPLLVDNCFSCHSEKKQKGGLRLDSLAAVQKGGKNGPILTPGKPGESKLIVAISYKDEDLQMPPDDQLSEEQVATLTQWVAMGAPWPASSAKLTAPLAKSKKRIITDEDRGFWSFQPVKDAVPPATDDGWCRNPIDHFILAKLQAEGLTPAPEADRPTLIRRLTFDLHGLPPTPAEVDAFTRDPAPDAYEKLLDRLLASPRYGEHWARHWLDLVRYAESDGFKQDAFRPNAWPYRDYVIKSFNDDKPYDRFVTEQLAADEIAPGDPTLAVATGYFRHGVYEYNQRDVPKQWSQMLDDVTDVTGDVFLGLSMGCARCHDHKFDPILQADYYRLRAFFAPMLPRNDLPLATAEEYAAYQAAETEWQKKATSLLDQIATVEKTALAKTAAVAIGKFPEETQALLQKPIAERTPEEEQLAQLAMRQVNDPNENPKPKLTGATKEQYDALKKQLNELEVDRPKAPLKTLSITDVGPIAPKTVIPGHEEQPLDPACLTVLDRQPLPLPKIESTAASTGRRTALARWITQPNNPLTTRVITNRIWQYHFGRGLVATSSDYGRLGASPTHPELLDYLAKRFVEKGWSFKAMHRLILTSATYRQAAVRPVPEVARMKDPENRWLWRMNTRRLDAEQVHDAMLAASSELHNDLGGPSAEPTAPRRAVYTKVLRNTRDPLMELFDSPETYSSVPVRNSTTTPNQALLMINGDWPLKRAAAFASYVRKASPSSDPATLVDTAYRSAYGRAPSPEESHAAVSYLLRHNSDTSKLAAALDAPITQTMPQRGGQAILIRNANPADMLRLPDGASPLFTSDFTIECYVQLESLYPDASVRVIASQWDGNQSHPGWAFGVTSEKSKHQPHNLILQIATKDGYEVIPSDLHVALHKAYYLAVALKTADTSESGVTFYLKDLTDNDAGLEKASHPHKLTTPIDTKFPLVIGGRPGAKPSASVQGWDGLIDEFRISHAVLTSAQILFNDGEPKEAIAGHWYLKESPGFFKDSTAEQPDLTRLAQKSLADTAIVPKTSIETALIDFCHVLLNSNEFLYVD